MKYKNNINLQLLCFLTLNVDFYVFCSLEYENSLPFHASPQDLSYVIKLKKTPFFAHLF